MFELALPENQPLHSTPSAPLEALWEVYPLTLSRLDEADSLALVEEFYAWRKQASRGTLARQFPLFLRERSWDEGQGHLPSLAEAEWMIFDIQQDPELPMGGFDRVSGASEEDWEKARFQFDPGHRLVRMEWCLTDILKDLNGAHDPKPGRFLIYRHHGQPKVRALKDNEADLIEALVKGEALGEIQEREDGPEFDAFLFHRWVESGFLRAIHWA